MPKRPDAVALLRRSLTTLRARGVGLSWAALQLSINVTPGRSVVTALRLFTRRGCAGKPSDPGVLLSQSALAGGVQGPQTLFGEGWHTICGSAIEPIFVHRFNWSTIPHFEEIS